MPTVTMLGWGGTQGTCWLLINSPNSPLGLEGAQVEEVIGCTCKQAHQLNLKAILSGWLWTIWGSGLAVCMGRVLLEGFSLENTGTVFSETSSVSLEPQSRLADVGTPGTRGRWCMYKGVTRSIAY